MVCLSKPYPFKFFKGCLPQILLGPLLNTLFYFTGGKHLKQGQRRDIKEPPAFILTKIVMRSVQ